MMTTSSVISRTGFWHEAYFMRGGMEAVYDDVPGPLGFGQFAQMRPARRGDVLTTHTRARADRSTARPQSSEGAKAYGVTSPQSHAKPK